MLVFHRSPLRCGLTLIELLAVIAVVGLMMALLLSAVQASRIATRRIVCASHLRQIGIALHSYHELHHTFPPGAVEPRPLWKNGRQFAWSAMLLPHIELAAVDQQINYDVPFDHPANAAVAATVVAAYLCPSTPRNSPLHRGRGACDYGGIFGERITGPNEPPKGIMLFDRAIGVREIRDGTTHTLIVAEDSNFPDGQWINGRNIFDQAFPINRAPVFENDIRSLHPGGANGLFADGSARFLQETMAAEILAAICTRAGSEALGGGQLE